MRKKRKRKQQRQERPMQEFHRYMERGASAGYSSPTLADAFWDAKEKKNVQH